MAYRFSVTDRSVQAGVRRIACEQIDKAIAEIENTELPLDETAAVVATACGPLGSNRAYLESLAAQLAALEIDDAYIARLLAQVRACGRS